MFCYSFGHFLYVGPVELKSIGRPSLLANPDRVIFSRLKPCGMSPHVA